ncbi:glycosyltransferase [bacterium]|nr:glycosyltransferase [bacterium]MBU1983111.1 glycosyltransferase [bacterium]
MNTLYFICPDDNRPAGGIKVLYRHVDILNRNGYQAAIVHKKKEFRSTWFENQTRVELHSRIQPDRFDFVVIPEVFGPRLADVFPGTKKIIFNRNAYDTFIGYSLDPRDLTTAYHHPDLVRVLVVSEGSRRYLTRVFPDLNVQRIHGSVDASLFPFRELTDKKPLISFWGREHREDAVQVVSILKFRGVLDELDAVSIEDVSEREVAAVLERSLIFLSFGFRDDFPSRSLEAMLSGCLVVGYHGMGGRECFNPEWSWPIEAGDIINFATATEEIINTFHKSPHLLQEKARKARDFVTREYSRDREERDVLAFWDDLMFEHGRDAIAEAP